MEQDPKRVQEEARRNPYRMSDASSLLRSDSSGHEEFVRKTSIGRGGEMGSCPRGSVSLSHDGSSPVVGEVADGGDRVVRDEMIGSGSMQDSIGRMSSRGSWRRGSISLTRNVSDRILDSISLSREVAEEILGDLDGSMIAQVGDSGDRVVVGDDKEDDNHNLSFLMDDVRTVENGVAALPNDGLILSNRSKSRIASSSSPVSPLAEDIISPLPTDAILRSSEKNQMQITRTSSFKEKLPRTLDYISYMIHLAVFGELGVFTRYLLQKLFGPGHLALTRDQTPLYLDLPSNMLGSFLMGWFGVVFKADIGHALSDHIAVGITTGYLGSLTTFSGWNQKMLDLSSKDHWVFAVAGILLGILIVNESIRVGVESADALRRGISVRFSKDPGRIRCCSERWRIDSPKRQIAVMTVMLIILISLWGLSGALARTKLDDVTNDAVLWLGCLVGPLGVWARWYLARLNGQGFGTAGLLKWLPVGTLSANVLAACIMAALATISKAVNTKRCAIIVSGVQFGFLGCLSTVSTFVAEVYAMRQSGHSGRALAYTAVTILLSFALGTLIYSVPVWTKHYN